MVSYPELAGVRIPFSCRLHGSVAMTSRKLNPMPPAGRIGHWSKHRRRWSSVNADEFRNCGDQLPSCTDSGPGNSDVYSSTVKKWEQWGKEWPSNKSAARRSGVSRLGVRACRRAGWLKSRRTANKAREHLRAVMAWAWNRISWLPFRDSETSSTRRRGRHYADQRRDQCLYFATHRMKRPKGWTSRFQSDDSAVRVGRVFNYGLDYADSGLCGVNEIRRSIAKHT